MFVCVLAILFFALLYFFMRFMEEISTENKFKPGYSFDTYELKYHADDSYKKTATYKIEANKNGYILVQDRTKGRRGAMKEFNIRELVYTVDKIIIKKENGEEVETLFKLDPYAY